MTIDKAIKILKKWHAGGYATRIDDMNPAVKLGIEALKRIKADRIVNDDLNPYPLPGETKE